MMAINKSEEDMSNCSIDHQIHQHVFSCVYILVLMVSDGSVFAFRKCFPSADKRGSRMCCMVNDLVFAGWRSCQRVLAVPRCPSAEAEERAGSLPDEPHCV